MLDDEEEAYGFALSAIAAGLAPDPELVLDEWSEAHIEVPRGTSSAHGEYRCANSPGARQVLQWLSPGHPCKRVVAMVASQLWKTQNALNWICGSIACSPDNILALEPSLPLAKRLSSRLQKTISKCEPLQDKVSSPRSRDARNTIDTKEFDGGTLYITTAGSAANLAEIPVRYLFGDEIDRWEGDLEGEGDPVKLAEARQTNFRRTRKAYFTSSPLIDGLSRIQKLFNMGTQNVPYVPCPHCGEEFLLEWECIDWDDELTKAWAICPNNACIIEESTKSSFLPRLRFVPQSAGDGETESCTMSVLYAPPRSISWIELVREYVDAEREQNAGNNGPMQVFWNTRLARLWRGGSNASTVEDLTARAESYAEFSVPAGALVLTCGVDVQPDRLAVSVWAWGPGEEGWLVYWGEIYGSTLVDKVGPWKDLEELILQRQYPHASGAQLRILRMTVDTGDGNTTQDAAYSFCRRNRRFGVLAGKGASERGGARKDIFTPPKKAVDVNTKNKAWKYGLQPYQVGTAAAKDLLIAGRLQLCDDVPGKGKVTGRGIGRLHWYADVRADFYEQLLSEVLVASRTFRGRKVWECKSGVRNEALDTLVYAFHAARALKINLWKPGTWQAIEQRLRQAELLPLAQAEAAENLKAELPGLAAGAAAHVAADEPDEPAESSAGQPGTDEVARPSPAAAVAPARKSTPRQGPPRRPGGFSINRW